MTLYEYKCENCGGILDRKFSMGTAPAGITCPQCAFAMHRTFSNGGFNMGNGYIPGVNGEHDMEHATDHYEHRIYSEDEQKQNIKAHKPNIGEV